jgi:hypothetical protein
MYGEVGRSPQGANLRTLGVYFPLLYQKFDWDLAVEYNHRSGELPLVNMVSMKKVGKDLAARAFVTRTSRDTIVGLGATLRFGNKGGSK